MAIADTIISMQTHTSNAYIMIGYGTDLTGINKNLANLSSTIFEAFLESLRNPDTLFTNLPKKSGTGANITLNDTANAPMRIELGASELTQDGTPTPDSPQDIHTISGSNKVVVCGRNKANPNTLFNEMYNSDVQIKPIKSVVDGKNVIEFLTNLFHKQYLYVTNYRTNTQYTFRFYAKQKSTSGSSTLFLVIDYTDGTSSNNSISSNGTSWGELRLVSTANKTIKDFYFSYATGTGWYLDTDSFNIIEGDTTSYEPYVPQEADIDLDTLQYCKIGNYEDKFIRNSGKNLFDINTLDGSANMTISNGKLILAGSTAYHVTNVGVNLKDIANLKVGETYYLNYKTTYTGSDYDKIYLRGTTSYWVNGTAHTITQAELDDRIAFYGTNNSEISELIISKENIDYEPYGSNEWYIKKNIGKVVLDGSENYSKASASASRIAYETSVADIVRYTDANSTPELISNRFTPVSYNATWKIGNISRWTGERYTVILIVDPSISTESDFATWVSNNNIEVYYQLATPTYTQITGTLANQLENVYKNMLSQTGQTNISQVNNDLSFELSVSAIEDLV